MPIAAELAALFHRDLTRLMQEVQAFPNDADLWAVAGVAGNSAGNLALHLEGNLLEYVGRQLGGVPFQRDRPKEFSTTGAAARELLERLELLRFIVVETVGRLSDGDLDAQFPEDVLGVPTSVRQLLIHLHGHLNYHLGQIDYLRRIVTGAGAIDLQGL
jgi:hypothetical protein